MWIIQVGKHIKAGKKQDCTDTVIYLLPIHKKKKKTKGKFQVFQLQLQQKQLKALNFLENDSTVSPNLKTAKLMGSEDGG